MRILFCLDSMDPRQVDPSYAAEAAAAERAGLSFSLIDYEALVDEKNPERAIRKAKSPESGTEEGLFRGWMLTPKRYAELYRALEGKGIRLINSLEAYVHCHHLPESYSVIEGRTPKSVWLSGGPNFDMGQLMEALRPFGDRPVILKDFVKSRKHEWAEACFIPSASHPAAVERVVRRFLELQGDSLAGGLVFREFIEFESVGKHPKSGMPLSREHRIFYLDGRPVLSFAYWADLGQVDEGPPEDVFDEVARRISSRFFTMDVAKRKDGDWMIVELGDGQVAGLPDDRLAEPFYKAIKDRLP